jgi:hypothetical protein
MKNRTLSAWHDIVASKSPDGLDALLADGVVFHSPVVHTPQVGKAITMQYLTAAIGLLGGGSFEYVREIVGPRDAVLEFQAEIDGLVINGVDLLRWDEEGKIVDFKVLLRPLQAMEWMRQEMAAALQAGRSEEPS